MAQELSRTRIHRSPLARLLSELARPAVPEPSQPFAERLGQWLDFKAGLALANALSGKATGTATPSGHAGAMRKAYARVRDTLTTAISADANGQASAEPPAAALAAPANGAADFAPFQRYYLGQQRLMAANVASLRATVRAALAQSSPAGSRLAAMDAVLEQAIAAREAALLAGVPALLAQRFQQLCEGRLDVPQQPSEHWQNQFRDELRDVLLAELELRLQPVVGLLAALDHEGSTRGE